MATSRHQYFYATDHSHVLFWVLFCFLFLNTLHTFHNFCEVQSLKDIQIQPYWYWTEINLGKYFEDSSPRYFSAYLLPAQLLLHMPYMYAEYYRIIDWFRLKGTLKIKFQSPCNGQWHLPLILHLNCRLFYLSLLDFFLIFIHFSNFSSSVLPLQGTKCMDVNHLLQVYSYFCFFFPPHWSINIEFILLKSPKILRYLPRVSSQTEAIVVQKLHWLVFK